MKKLFAVVLSLVLCLTFAACGEKEDGNVYEGTASKTEKTADTSPVDLTALSSTMVYSEVYNMMNEPKKYVGRTVTMNGAFAIYQNQDNTQQYAACIIKDATACCSQGLEFVLAGDAKYPNEGDEITVKGTFQTYDENGQIFCHVVDATIL